jgi:hypothetical protein
MAGVVSVSATGNQDIDGLLGGTAWAGVVTYSFTDSSSDYSADYGYGETTDPYFSAIPTALQAAVAYAVSLVASYTNIVVQFTGTDGADIAVAQTSVVNPTSWAYLPDPAYAEGGDAWFGTAYDFSQAAPGSYYFADALHELGHSFGLKHSQDGGGVSNVALPTVHDNLEYTVMSYRSYAGADVTGSYTNEDYGYVQTYMANDILALQTMYGANFATQSGNTVYTWNPTTGQEFINGVGQLAPGDSTGGATNRIFETIWDGGGVDSYDLSNYTTELRINLNPGASSVFSSVQLAYLGDGHYASGNVYNAYLYNGDARSYIDNATGGSGNDTIIGNEIANVLNGGFGNDTITGGRGNDTIIGGAGNDTATYSGNHTDYAISYNSSSQIFTVADQRSGSLDGTDTVSSVENFHFADGTIASANFTGSNLQPAGSGWITTITQDFDNDGHDDILWLQPSSGIGKIVYQSGGSVTGTASFTTLGQGWSVIGHGDYNHDGNIDLLWQNQTTGQASESLLFAGQITNTFNFGVMDANWKLISSGDFNGDGTSDILWRNSVTGEGIEWFCQNGYASSWMRFGVMTPDWKVASTVDLNQDGTTDILWQNTKTGEGLEWFCQNGYATGWQRFGTMGAGWDVVATADLNGDARIDLLWQDGKSGRLVEWFINDQGYAFDWKDLGTPDPNWKVTGLLDLQATDGPMILLQNAATGVTTEISSSVAGSANALAASHASTAAATSIHWVETDTVLQAQETPNTPNYLHDILV